MEELLQSNQFHRLLDPGIAHHQEPLLLVVAVLGQLDQGTKVRRIDAIDMGEIN